MDCCNFARREEHRRNERLEDLLKEINGLLGPVERKAVASFGESRFPFVLVMGSPRSGTTLFMQWLASTGCFCYPTNLLSRFYDAPYIGAKIQLMLTEHDFNNEIFDFNEAVPFASNLGKTKGVLAPNEFWYFWRRFFKFGEIQKLTDDELKDVDHKELISELASIESVFGRPFAAKGMILNWNIPYLAEVLDKVLFVYIRRHPFYNAQSLLRARLNYYGDIRGWYSFKPPEYHSLKDNDPYEQVAGQIYHTNRAIEEGLQGLDEARVVSVEYEEFCKRPEVIYMNIMEKLSSQGCNMDRQYKGEPSFVNTNTVALTNKEAENIVVAYRKLTGVTLTP